MKRNRSFKPSVEGCESRALMSAPPIPGDIVYSPDPVDMGAPMVYPIFGENTHNGPIMTLDYAHYLLSPWEQSVPYKPDAVQDYIFEALTFETYQQYLLNQGDRYIIQP
jgi:hypothetical protein